MRGRNGICVSVDDLCKARGGTRWGREGNRSRPRVGGRGGRGSFWASRSAPVSPASTLYDLFPNSSPSQSAPSVPLPITARGCQGRIASTVLPSSGGWRWSVRSIAACLGLAALPKCMCVLLATPGGRLIRCPGLVGPWWACPLHVTSRGDHGHGSRGAGPVGSPFSCRCRSTRGGTYSRCCARRLLLHCCDLRTFNRFDCRPCQEPPEAMSTVVAEWWPITVRQVAE